MIRKILVIILVGFVIFLIAGIIRTPEKVLPMRQIRQLTKSYKSCPSPFIFKMPIDIKKVTSVLYPGQYRGGDYKPHGGFRFDNSRPDEIEVIAPYDAEVTAGARYLEGGEVQYIFDFAHPCGIKYRFDHLLTLTPKLQAIADKFPIPKESDSRTTTVNPPIEVKQGEVIATAIGFTRGGNSGIGNSNTGVDWGVYDYRQKNESSKNPEWLAKHSYEIESYAICWFDWISSEDKLIILSLPSSDFQSGKTSDYCK